MSVIRIGTRACAALACLSLTSFYAFAQGGGAASASASASVASNGVASAASAASAGVMAKPSGAASSSKSADRALARRVVNALEKAKGLRAGGITVRAKNGAVVLEGWVPDAAQIDMATRVAQGVAGVESVRNALTLSTL